MQTNQARLCSKPLSLLNSHPLRSFEGLQNQPGTKQRGVIPVPQSSPVTQIRQSQTCLPSLACLFPLKPQSNLLAMPVFHSCPAYWSQRFLTGPHSPVE